MKPLAIDLFCGLGGWTEGLQAAGWDVIGFDIERHVYGEHQYPAQLVVQDVLTLNGTQFRDAGLIVASPPCQEYSYMAMPWKRAKQIERALRGEDEFPESYKGSRTVAELNALFDACFRIQCEAEAVAGRRIPLVVENVCGAQKWVGPARWRHGSYYLWGDVPALMPIVRKHAKVGGLDWSKHNEPDYRTSGASGCFRDMALKNNGGSWFRVAHNTKSGKNRNPVQYTPHMTNPDEHRGVKHQASGAEWFNGGAAAFGSASNKRKLASAMIAKIPYDLARHIGGVYAP